MGGIYSHHGIDCGDGTVIHYWPDGDSFRSSVQRTTLEEFAEGGSVRVRQYAACDPPGTVVGRAASSLGARGFDPLKSNCEHFAVWCKTGKVESSQTKILEPYLSGQTGDAPMSLLLSPLVPLIALAAFVRNVLGGLSGETRDPTSYD